VYVSECGSKNGSGGISVAREPKWDLCLETRRGKCNRASREPERVPLGAKCGLSVHAQADSTVCSGCSGRAQAVLRNAQECSPSAQVKAAAAHVQTLKRNQRKKKLSLTYLVISTIFFPTRLVSGGALWLVGDWRETKPLRKQRSNPQVSEVFCSVSIDL
jgi:hypothetical protein